MDDKEVAYSEDVYNTIVQNYTRVLVHCRVEGGAAPIPYSFVPYCGLTQVEGTSENISSHSTKMPWYTEKNLVDTIDSIELKTFDASAPAVAKMTKLTHPKGVGSIITATVLSGEFRPGMKIIIKPAFVETEIKTIQSNNNFVEVARVNDAIGIAIKEKIKKDELDTDSLISEIPRAPKMVCEITARVRVEPRLEKQVDKADSKSGNDRKINMLSYLQKIQLYISTTRVSAEVTEILGIYGMNKETRRPELSEKSAVPVSRGKRQKLHVPQKATALVRFVLERPVVVSREGPECITKLSKIIINDGRETIALGTITDYKLALNETS
jgi:translation elongation factor EF-1alpha